MTGSSSQDLMWHLRFVGFFYFINRVTSDLQITLLSELNFEFEQ